MVALTAVNRGQRSGGDMLAQGSSSRYRLALVALLGLALIVAGGASRYDEPQQLLVRLAAVAVIAGSLWPLQTAPLRSNSRLLVAAGAVYGLVLLQLVPLPPGLWAQLPGRAVHAEIAEAAGAVGWRPLSLTPDLTLNALFALLPPTAAGLAALYLDSGARRRVWTWIVAAALFSGTLGLVQLGAGGNAFRLYRETSLDSAVGLFANRNHHAAFLACALPLIGALSGLRLRDGGGAWPVAIVAIGSTALLLLALIATGSRSGLVLGTIGTLGAIWCFRATGERVAEPRLRPRLVAVGVGALMLAAVAFAAVRVGVFERLAQTDPAAETRAAMIEPLLRTAEAFMPVGSGFGSFDSVYRRFEPDVLLSTIYMNQAHNELLQLAIEGGVPALALLAVFLVWWLTPAICIARADIPSTRRTIAIAAVVITAILMSSSLLDYPLRTPLLGAVFVFACVEMMRGAALRERRKSSAPNSFADRS